MVIFAPEGPVKHTVTVFTDIDCGYCRKLHTQIDAYNKEGIKIRYLWFPREGIGSESYNKAVAVWCAADRRAAMTKAKRGENVERKTCDNPVKREYELGPEVGGARHAQHDSGIRRNDSRLRSSDPTGANAGGAQGARPPNPVGQP
jgi:thiol:disulfide interchange protein DsbC